MNIALSELTLSGLVKETLFYTWLKKIKRFVDCVFTVTLCSEAVRGSELYQEQQRSRLWYKEFQSAFWSLLGGTWSVPGTLCIISCASHPRLTALQAVQLEQGFSYLPACRVRRNQEIHRISSPAAQSRGWIRKRAFGLLIQLLGWCKQVLLDLWGLNSLGFWQLLFHINSDFVNK